MDTDFDNISMFLKPIEPNNYSSDLGFNYSNDFSSSIKVCRILFESVARHGLFGVFYFYYT